MTPGKDGMESICLDPHPNKLKKNKKTVNASEGRVEGGALGRSGG